MHNLGHLPVHRQRAAHDARAKRFADRLMAEADAEEWNVCVRANEIDDAAGARRNAGTGRDYDRARTLGEQRVDVECVIAHDAQRGAGDALDLLDQVVGEGVVVVDDGDGRVNGGAKDASRPRVSPTRSPGGSYS